MFRILIITQQLNTHNMANNINNDFWIAQTSKSFPIFFNDNNAKRGSWSVATNGESINIRCGVDTNNQLSNIFTQTNIKLITGNDDINIYQFLAMVSIMINETGGQFRSITEFGDAEYMYNYKSGVKGSYNCSNTTSKYGTSLGNISAFELFHNPVFLNVPARLSMYKPKNMGDEKWKGYTYPSNEPRGKYVGSDGYSELGLIGECDFYKFRGRGLIQLTGRENYKNFIGFIIQNKTEIKTSIGQKSLKIIDNWGLDDLETIATKITNIELDILFADPSINVLVFRTHGSNKILRNLYTVNDSNSFLDLLYAYGKRIGGNDKYAKLFTNRVFEILENIPNWVVNDQIA